MYSSFLLKASVVSVVVFSEVVELSPFLVVSVYLSFFLEDYSFLDSLEPDFFDLDLSFFTSTLVGSDLGNA